MHIARGRVTKRAKMEGTCVSPQPLFAILSSSYHPLHPHRHLAQRQAHHPVHARVVEHVYEEERLGGRLGGLGSGTLGATRWRSTMPGFCREDARR